MSGWAGSSAQTVFPPGGASRLAGWPLRETPRRALALPLCATEEDYRGRHRRRRRSHHPMMDAICFFLLQYFGVALEVADDGGR
jgi:hypothetical protein